jgi:hypoxanthine phosphoribosyltransferase
LRIDAGGGLTDPRLRGQPLNRIVYRADEIAERVATLGVEVAAAYPDGELLVLGLLKGSFIFLSDLVRQIARPLQVDFVVAASYGDKMVSSGSVRLLYDPQASVQGKHILIVEDIIDSGRTLNRVIEVLDQRGASTIEVCALLDKDVATERVRTPRFVGFHAPDEFLVGYGLDHAENFRHLPYIASLQ